jgi:hypothetical protein
MPDLATATWIMIAGQRVTFDRYPTQGWVATGWEKGLPVARRPVALDYLEQVLSRFAPEQITWTV